MAIAYNWNIVQTDYKVSDKFIVTVHYNVTATDGDYSANTYGTVGYTEEAGKSYIPYDQLTQDEVVAWVKDSLGQETVESSLASQINALKNPVQESGLPWAA
jgi:hypothetical protein